MGLSGVFFVLDGALRARVATLMLLWRRGILLFQDVHPKARTALPAILETLRGAG